MGNPVRDPTYVIKGYPVYINIKSVRSCVRDHKNTYFHQPLNSNHQHKEFCSNN